MRTIFKSTATVLALVTAMNPAFAASDMQECMSEGVDENVNELVDTLLLTPADELEGVALGRYSVNMLGRTAVEISDSRLGGMIKETNRSFNTLADAFNDKDDLDFDRAVENSPLAAADAIRALEAGDVNVVTIDQATLKARIDVVNHVAAVLGRIDQDYMAKSQLCWSPE